MTAVKVFGISCCPEVILGNTDLVLFPSFPDASWLQGAVCSFVAGSHRNGTDEEGWFWFHKCAGESGKGVSGRAPWLGLNRVKPQPLKAAMWASFMRIQCQEEITVLWHFEKKFWLPFSLIWCSQNESLAEHHDWPEKIAFNARLNKLTVLLMFVFFFP